MNEQEQLPYFAPLLPWQRQAWRQLTGQFIEQRMPHGLLAAGQKASVSVSLFSDLWRIYCVWKKT